ncbi:electron transporter RnfB [Achromatium sp. WMS2]|nr:electron transporter RnfB [Achromatium sp. WMS2]
MLAAIVVLATLAAVAGLILGYVSLRFKVEGNPIAEQIDVILPQTQCGQCGYPGCKPYAQAVASGEADINKCVPGGTTVVIALADLLGRKPKAPAIDKKAPERAIIEETECIGCTLCIQACPVDAIVGAPKHLHQVLASECTGCALCLPPCPVECITMIPIVDPLNTWRWPLPNP